MLIDIGLNLADKQLRPHAAELLTQARAAGVSGFLLTGSSLNSSNAVQALAEAQPDCLCTAGIHPHDADRWDAATAQQIRHLSQLPLTAAVGETGLDYNRNFSSPTNQRHAFTQQLSIATELGKPVFLHERDAHDDFQAILAEHRAQLTGAVVHCFTGTAAALERYLQLDCYIGITGWVCDERRGQALQTLLPEIPDNRLLLETDAPYLLPRSLRPKPKSRRNEPRYLPHIAQTVATLRNTNVQQLSAVTTANATRLFGEFQQGTVA